MYKNMALPSTAVVKENTDRQNKTDFLLTKNSFLSLTYFDFLQFDQKVGQYHLVGADLVITKSDSLLVTNGVNTVRSYIKFRKLCSFGKRLTKGRKKYLANVLIKMIPTYPLWHKFWGQ